MSCRPDAHSLQEALDLRRSGPDEIARQQPSLLRRHLQHAATFPFYHRLFKETSFSPDRVNSISDLACLPLIGRKDVENAHDAFSSDAVPAIADIALTSGTTGNPLVVPYTANDLERLAFNEEVAFYSAGLREGDRVLLTITLDRCFIAGFAYFRGLVRLGATAIRSGPGQPARQWQLIERLHPTALLGVPSFLLGLARWGSENGYNPKVAGIKTIITIGEPIRKADFTPTRLGQFLQECWGAKIFSSYGVTELETAFGDCPAACGAHIHPELMIVEIVDDHGKVLPNGQPGEVIATPLGVEGFPLIRFRTGDIARIHTDPCSCGWNTPRLGPIEGRLSQRLKYKGTTLYSAMIFHALQEIPGATDVYIEVRQSFDLSDEVTVVIGTDEHGPDLRRIEEALQAHLRVRPEVILKDRSAVKARMHNDLDRKPRNFFDFRKKNQYGS
jgi:phenylacetate-CoA ligase